MPPAEMVAALEKYGFSAIYLNRKGFPDGGESLVKSLAVSARRTWSRMPNTGRLHRSESVAESGAAAHG